MTPQLQSIMEMLPDRMRDTLALAVRDSIFRKVNYLFGTLRATQSKSNIEAELLIFFIAFGYRKLDLVFHIP
jgi:CRISPR/Cas system-associated protein endoribonuclease Cas2